MHSRVDPTTTLREEHTPVLGRRSLGLGIAHKDGLVVAKVLEHECRKVTILTEVEQVLGVQRVDAILGVGVYDAIGDK